MKMIYARRSVLIFVLLGISVSSPAVIVGGLLTSSATNAHDEYDLNPEYSNFWSPTVNNQPITKSSLHKLHKTDLVPPVLENQDLADYSYDNQLTRLEWLDLTYNIDSELLSASDFSPGGFNFFGNINRMEILARGNRQDWAHGNYLSRMGLNTAKNRAGNLALNYGYLGVRQPITDMGRGLGLMRDFSWSRSGRAEQGMGTLETYSQVGAQPFYAWESVDVASLTVSPQQVSVPAPSSLYLFVLGLFGLALRLWKLRDL